MRRLSIISFVLALFVWHPVQAQSLEEGIWVGRMIAPTGKIDTLYMHVDIVSGKPKIDLELDTQKKFSATDVRLDDHSLHFNWYFDMDIECILYKQENKSYQGVCTDEKKNKGPLTFVPSSYARSNGKKVERIFEDWAYYWKGRKL